MGANLSGPKYGCAPNCSRAWPWSSSLSGAGVGVWVGAWGCGRQAAGLAKARSCSGTSAQLSPTTRVPMAS